MFAPRPVHRLHPVVAAACVAMACTPSHGAGDSATAKAPDSTSIPAALPAIDTTRAGSDTPSTGAAQAPDAAVPDAPVPDASLPNASVPNAQVPNATGSGTRPAPNAGTPGDADSTGRPRLRPRPPHPVPRPMPRPDSAPAAAVGDTSDGERAAIERLRREARALAHTDGCTAVAGCAVQPLGERPCGGPEEYLVYCARTTDVPALRRKADALARAERAYNAKHEIISTCEYRIAPAPQLVGGSCQAARGDGKPTLPP